MTRDERILALAARNETIETLLNEIFHMERYGAEPSMERIKVAAGTVGRWFYAEAGKETQTK